MANPKRQHSHARQAKRRSQWKLSPPTLSKCPNCSQVILSHTVCLHCGMYKNRSVLIIKIKEKKKE